MNEEYFGIGWEIVDFVVTSVYNFLLYGWITHFAFHVSS